MSSEFDTGYSEAPQYESAPQVESAPQYYEHPEYRSRFEPEVEAALNAHFESFIGPKLAPFHEAQRIAEVSRGVESFERQYNLSREDMNEVLETALQFGEEIVNKMPMAQLLDYAYRVWAGDPQGFAQAEPQGPPTEQSTTSDRVLSQIDKWNKADAMFERQLGSDDEWHNIRELQDASEKYKRGTRSAWDIADEKTARVARGRETW